MGNWPNGKIIGPGKLLGMVDGGKVAVELDGGEHRIVSVKNSKVFPESCPSLVKTRKTFYSIFSDEFTLHQHLRYIVARYRDKLPGTPRSWDSYRRQTDIYTIIGAYRDHDLKPHINPCFNHRDEFNSGQFGWYRYQSGPFHSITREDQKAVFACSQVIMQYCVHPGIEWRDYRLERLIACSKCMENRELDWDASKKALPQRIVSYVDHLHKLGYTRSDMELNTIKANMEHFIRESGTQIIKHLSTKDIELLRLT